VVWFGFFYRIKKQIHNRYQGKQTLIILDNFETILNLDESNRVIDLVSYLCEYSIIVNTSRQIINLEYEEVYELRNMTSEEGTILFKTFYKGVVSENEETFFKKRNCRFSFKQ